MMSRESGSERSVLGDLSNVNGKRGLPLAPGKFVIGGGDVDFGSRKRLRRGNENVGDDCSYSSGKSKSGSGIGSGKKGKEMSSALNPGLHLIRGNVVANRSGTKDSLEASTAKRSGSQSESLCRKGCENKVGNFSLYTTSEGCSAQPKDTISTGSQSNFKEMLSSRLRVGDCFQMPALPTYHDFMGALGDQSVRDDHPSHVDSDTVEGKGCSCSLCLKAKYIWADLLYEDVLGRLDEVKKNRRETSILVAKSYIRDVGHNSAEKNTEKFKEFTKLEYDLMQRWRSLFLHTEHALVEEGTRLQEELNRLKELRADCRKELEQNCPSSR